MQGGPTHYFVKDRCQNTAVGDIAPTAEVVRYLHVGEYPIVFDIKFHLKAVFVLGAAPETIMIPAGWKQSQIFFQCHD
jgi:hypothetical protein